MTVRQRHTKIMFVFVRELIGRIRSETCKNSYGVGNSAGSGNSAVVVTVL